MTNPSMASNGEIRTVYRSSICQSICQIRFLITSDNDFKIKKVK